MARKPKLTAEDIQLFRDTVRGVKRLRSDRVAAQPPRRRRTARPTPPSRRDEGTFAIRDDIVAVAPDESLRFARDGVQPAALRKLQRGQWPLQGTLDLHGMTADEAALALAHFIDHGVQAGRRAVLVIHGKGYRSAGARPVLKSHVNQWLQQCPHVLAFCSAQPVHGGAGAVYVLLKSAR